MTWSTSEINDQGEEEETDDRDDLDTGEDEFGLTIDCNGEDVETKDDSNDDADPCSNLQIVSSSSSTCRLWSRYLDQDLH